MAGVAIAFTTMMLAVAEVDLKRSARASTAASDPALEIEYAAFWPLGFAAMVFPWRRPEIYRASSTVRSALGIPLVSIAGGAAVASGLILLFLFFKYEALGIADTGPLFQWLGGTLVVAAVFYVAAIYYRRSQGVDVRRAYAEIPPE